MPLYSFFCFTGWAHLQQVSVADDLFQAVGCRSFIQIRKIKGKSGIASQIVIYINGSRVLPPVR